MILLLWTISSVGSVLVGYGSVRVQEYTARPTAAKINPEVDDVFIMLKN